MRNAWGVFLRRYEVEPYGLSNKHGDAFCLHLVHDLDAISFDGAGADFQPFCNGFARVALDDQIKDFHFSLSRSIEASADVFNSLLETSLCVGACQAPVDHRNELNIVNRLLNEVLGAGLDCGHCHGHVGVPGDDHDGQRDLTTRELADKLNSVHARHANIGNDTAMPQRVEHPQKAVSGLVGFDALAEGTEHLAKSMADRRLVIDDEDRRRIPYHARSGGSGGSERRNSIAPGSFE